MANRQNEQRMPAQPGRSDRGSSRDDRTRTYDEENVRGVGESDDDEFEEIEELEEDEEEEGNF